MAASTLFVRNLPASATNGRMEEIFSEIGPVKNCFVVKEKGTDKCRGFGYVTFAMVDDSQRALREIKEYDGKKISVVVAKRKQNDKKKAAPKQPTPENQKPKGLKKNQLKARLIIRNLSFKCSADDLRQVFSEFGTVLDVNIPLKPDGKMRGFAFVQLKNVLQAGKALKATNLKEIKGRPVAVDWAVAKDKFVAAQQASSSGATKQPAEQEQGTEEDSQPKKPSAKTAAKEVRHSKQEVDPESDSESESTEQDSEEDDDDDDEDDEEEEEEASAAMDSDHSGSGSDEDDDEDDDDDDDDGDSDEEPPVKRKPLPSDVKEGRTVFIRNLSFETEEEGLEEVLLQYGELKYIRIVLHPDTEHSKGCAFAQFKTKEAADRCLAAAQDQSESGGIRVDGRKLNVVLAVSREDAVKLKDDKKVKVQTGTRNLYLAREGLIRAGTKAAEGIPAADMAKRARFEELKRVKLRDIQVFVSKTRLCVHNLPKSVDQKQLRALCLKAAGGGKGVRITECRVMYDKKPEAGKIMGRSLGYGFVQFQNHDHALSVLRHLNNNPEIFGPQKRPIVEFSLEDGRKLKMKEMRSQKQAQRMRKGVAPGGAQPQKAGGGASKVPQKSGGGASKGPQKSGGGASKGPQQSGGGASKRPAESGGGAGNPAGGVSSHFSGFRTKPEVEEVELADGKKRKKVLPLPKKSGPKIRNRDRGKVQPTQPKQKPHRPSRRDRVAGLSMEKQSQPPLKRATKGARKPLRNREDQRFDSLVEQYKRRIMGNPSKPAVKKSKWFSS